LCEAVHDVVLKHASPGTDNEMTVAYCIYIIDWYSVRIQCMHNCVVHRVSLVLLNIGWLYFKKNL
jgi:hypothetical protein